MSFKSFTISTPKQANLWGRQSDASSDIGLEPQRVDLFYVDFTNAVKGVNAVSGQSLPPIIPQYVRSCTLPELRTKADAIRQDSVPFNMPSWDDPLDAVKIVFLLETSSQSFSTTVALLDTWLALTRAGRGSRRFGYYTTGWYTLNANYTVDFRFSLYLKLLRGGRVGNMTLHSVYTLKNAWLAAYKMTDYNYTDSGLVTVEATFYVDSVTTENVEIGDGVEPNLFGMVGSVSVVEVQATTPTPQPVPQPTTQGQPPPPQTNPLVDPPKEIQVQPPAPAAAPPYPPYIPYVPIT